jgi:hypothetical protein
MSLLCGLNDLPDSQPQAAELAGKHILGHCRHWCGVAFACASPANQIAAMEILFCDMLSAAEKNAADKGDDRHGQFNFKQRSHIL